MLDIKGAVAVITGGYGGIGMAVARSWGEKGGKVVLAARTRERLLKAEDELRGKGVEVVSIACDVTKEKDNQALARYAVETFGAINSGSLAVDGTKAFKFNPGSPHTCGNIMMPATVNITDVNICC